MGTWPRLMGQLLSALAKNLKDPDVPGLQVDASFDRLSDNVLETWGTCYWCIQACWGAAIDQSFNPKLTGIFESLRKDLYGAIGLKGDDICHPIIMKSFDGLNKRYSEMLGLDAQKLTTAHQSVVEKNNHN